MSRTILVATANPGKLREFAEALGGAGFEVVGLETLDDRTEVDETGDTFEANARLKAEGYSLRSPHLVLADDSGLEVDALDGAPGVLSARYGGPGLDDAGRNRKVLEALAGVTEPERRTAPVSLRAGHRPCRAHAGHLRRRDRGTDPGGAPGGERVRLRPAVLSPGIGLYDRGTVDGGQATRLAPGEGDGGFSRGATGRGPPVGLSFPGNRPVWLTNSGGGC